MLRTSFTIFLQTIFFPEEYFQKIIHPQKLPNFSHYSSSINGQNLELFGNNYQNQSSLEAKTDPKEGSKTIFFSHIESSLRKRNIYFVLNRNASLLTHTQHTYVRACVRCGCPSREMSLSPSAPEEFNRKSIKVTRQLVVARLCTGAIVKAKPVILYIRQREPTPNQYPLWYIGRLSETIRNNRRNNL